MVLRCARASSARELRYEGKGLSADEFYWLVLKNIISRRLVGFTRQKKERKNHAARVLVVCCLTCVINGKMIEDGAIYNFWRFLVEDFFLPVIKPPGTYFNTKLSPSCRSSKFSSSFPASSVLLSGAPNDNFRKISLRKTICDLEFSENLL